MSPNKFLKMLLLTIVLSLIGIFGANSLLGDRGDWRISWIAVIFFSLISVLIYLFGQKASKSEDRYSFLRLILINVMIKVVACFGIVGVYYNTYQPESRFFILPFLLVYLVFTVFETYVLLYQSNRAKT